MPRDLITNEYDTTREVFSFLDSATLTNVRLANKASFNAYREFIAELLLAYITSLDANEINQVIMISESHLKKYNGEIPLILSIKIRSMPCIDAAIAKNAGVNVKDLDGNNPAHFALQTKNSLILKKVLSIDNPNNTILAKPNYMGQYPMYYLGRGLSGRTFFSHEQNCMSVFNNYIDNNVPDGAIGFYAQSNQNDTHVNIDWRKGKITNVFLNESMQKIKNAIRSHNLRLIHYYKDLLASFIYFGKLNEIRPSKTIFHLAVLAGSDKILNQLLNLSVEKIAITKLVWVDNYDTYIVSNAEEIQLKVEDFIKKYINFKDEDGNTPLHIAVKNQNLKIVKILINHGAIESINEPNNPKSPDKPGETPLQLSQEDNRPNQWRNKTRHGIGVGGMKLKIYYYFKDILKNQNQTQVEELSENRGLRMNF